MRLARDSLDLHVGRSLQLVGLGLLEVLLLLGESFGDGLRHCGIDRADQVHVTLALVDLLAHVVESLVNDATVELQLFFLLIDALTLVTHLALEEVKELVVLFAVVEFLRLLLRAEAHVVLL